MQKPFLSEESILTYWGVKPVWIRKSSFTIFVYGKWRVLNLNGSPVLLYTTRLAYVCRYVEEVRMLLKWVSEGGSSLQCVRPFFKLMCDVCILPVWGYSCRISIDLWNKVTNSGANSLAPFFDLIRSLDLCWIYLTFFNTYTVYDKVWYYSFSAGVPAMDWSSPSWANRFELVDKNLAPTWSLVME
jgi:hypothetical protein